MKNELEIALAHNSLKATIEYFERAADETMSQEERERYIATAFYLKAYNKLPF